MQEDQFNNMLYPAAPIEDTDVCIAKLSDPDPQVVYESAFNLSWHDNPRKVEPLLQLLKNDNENIRWAAVMGLSQTREPHIEEVIINLSANDPDPQVRSAAISYLIHGSKKALAAIATASADSNPEVRSSVASAFLWRRCRLGVKILRHLLSDSEWNVRHAACSTLLHHKISDTQLISVVEHLSQEPEAAQYDERVITVRKKLREQEQSPSLDHIISATKTMQEMLDCARELAGKRRGIWGLIRH